MTTKNAPTEDGKPHTQRLARRLLLVFAVAASCTTLLASTAQAADELFFNPVLSLTGDTSTSSLDEVPDPGPNHPSASFNNPCGVDTDRFGNIYVASSAAGNKQEGTGGRIDVFDAGGHYITQIKDELQPCPVAVDSEGHVYVHRRAGSGGAGPLVMYVPSSFPPTAATTYGVPVTIVPAAVQNEPGPQEGVAVDPSNDHLYVSMRDNVREYDSAANGSGLLDNTIGTGLLDGRGPVADPNGIDVYGANHDVYVASSPRNPYEPLKPVIYVLDGADGHVKVRVDGSDDDALVTDKTPENGFDFSSGRGAVAVDQSNGDFYVSDGGNKAVYRFAADGQYLATLERSFKTPIVMADVAVDNPIVPGEAGYESPNAGHVFVTSGDAPGNSHLYAFGPKLIGPPEVAEQKVTQITDTEAILRAEVNPKGLPATYRFEYTTQADFEANGYANAIHLPAVDASLAAGGSFVAVSQQLTGLSPAVAYRFRVVASNEECTTEGEGITCAEGDDAGFSTYPSKAGPSERGYELVTPPDTGGRIPTASAFGELGGYPTRLASPDGESLLFGVEGGSLPGLPGGGFYDSFIAKRGPTGAWQSSFAGLTGAEAEKSYPGGGSVEQSMTLHVVSGDNGSLAPGFARFSYYLRHGDAVEPVGRGSFGDDATAVARWVSDDGEHLVFVTGLGLSPLTIQLEPEAPLTGTAAVYDRTPGGQTQVVSLLPGEVTPASGASFVGASADASTVLFEVAGTTYARLNNAETIEVSSAAIKFAGTSEKGRYVFYLQGGDIFRLDTETLATTQVASGGESTIVNVSADGSHVYLVSPLRLDGAKGEVGKNNLYVWDGGEPRFIAVLTERDVVGDPKSESEFIGGLGLWAGHAVSRDYGRSRGPANAPSRTTPDGEYLLFESRAELTPYDNPGQTEVYRYDDTAGSLDCLSCNPTGVPASSDDSLQSRTGGSLSTLPPVNAITEIANITADGGKAFFQSSEALVLEDLDGKLDVYQWRAEGSGGCEREGGCLSLISSGKSEEDEYLYAMSPDGHDVFFWSADVLSPRDPDGTPSIYDARIGGGDPPPPPPLVGCEAEACYAPSSPPLDQTPASLSFQGRGNPAPPRRGRCPAGKRRVRKAGKARCVKRQGKAKRSRANAKRRDAR